MPISTIGTDGLSTSPTLTTPKATTTIGVGNATPAASGAGITFPAAVSASSDVNTLDDYEEGTFTPTLTFGTGSTGIAYNRQYARYTKIGNRVLVNMYLSLTSKGSSTGSAQINGLPFANVSGSLSGATTACTFNPPQISYSGLASATVDDAATTVTLGQVTTAGVSSALNDTNFAFNSVVQLMFHYQTA